MGYTADPAGIAVAPLGLAPLFFSGLIGKLVNKIGQIIPIGLSLLFFALSSFVGAFFNTMSRFSMWPFPPPLWLWPSLFHCPDLQLSGARYPTDRFPIQQGCFTFSAR